MEHNIVALFALRSWFLSSIERRKIVSSFGQSENTNHSSVYLFVCVVQFVCVGVVVTMVKVIMTKSWTKGHSGASLKLTFFTHNRPYFAKLDPQAKHRYHLRTWCSATKALKH